MLTPTEETYYNYLLDKPSTITQLSKVFATNYHGVRSHLRNLESKGYILRRPNTTGSGSFEFFVPDSRRSAAGSFRLANEEVTIEELLVGAFDHRHLENHIRKSALAVAHLSHHSLLPRPDMTDPKSVIQLARRYLLDYCTFLDRISRMSPEVLREQLGEVHPVKINEWEEKWQQHNKTEIPKFLPAAEQYLEGYGETASWKEIEMD